MQDLQMSFSDSTEACSSSNINLFKSLTKLNIVIQKTDADLEVIVFYVLQHNTN